MLNQSSYQSEEEETIKLQSVPHSLKSKYFKLFS